MARQRDKSKRRWWQFSLRQLLLVFLLLCIGLAWLGAKYRKAIKQRKTVAEIQKLGGTVRYYTSELDEIAGNNTWLPEFLSPDRVAIVYLHSQVVTDNDLVHLRELTDLLELWLDGTQITDDGLAHLKGLKNLRVLFLHNTNVTDAGLVHLVGLKNLVLLRLDDTQITDAGLMHLRELDSLNVVALENTNVTNKGLRDLQRAMPNLTLNSQLPGKGNNE